MSSDLLQMTKARFNRILQFFLIDLFILLNVLVILRRAWYKYHIQTIIVFNFVCLFKKIFFVTFPKEKADIYLNNNSVLTCVLPEWKFL